MAIDRNDAMVKRENAQKCCEKSYRFGYDDGMRELREVLIAATDTSGFGHSLANAISGGDYYSGLVGLMQATIADETIKPATKTPNPARGPCQACIKSLKSKKPRRAPCQPRLPRR